jgi:uncharacterized membrane protein YebE (DUF533 family)
VTRTAFTAALLASIASVGATAYAAYYMHHTARYGPASPTPLEVWVTSKFHARRIDREWRESQLA